MGFKTLNDSGTGTLWNKVKSYVNTRLKAFGSVATEDIVPINKGGTGAADVAGALANLGIGDYVVNVATVNSLSDSDLLFVNSGGSLKQVTKANSGMVTMDLLWENASPTSSFANQTINLDMTEYDLIKVHFNLDANKRALPSFDSPTGRACFYESSGYTRHFAISTDKITFTDASNAGAIIPVKIFGIKGVQ